jgi:glycerol-3-phosphate acyltransferase PlsX
MGSDAAPAPDIQGAVQAARRFHQEIILVGRDEVVRAELAKHDTQGLAISVAPASQVIEMAEHPAQAVRANPDASMVVGMRLVRDGQADAFVSMGNSGGVLASALLGDGRLGRIPGVRRPALSTVIPNLTGYAFMLDIGANADCQPEWLAQFAVMGAAYAKRVLGIANPRVGLLANGEEETKGSQLVQTAHGLLKQLDLNFVGNVEGKDITAGVADVVVSDGFAGNVAVKTAEGAAKMLMTLIKQEIKARPLAMLGGLLAKPAFSAAGKRLDYRQYGGGPLLGVNGVVIIGHGRSDALAVENAVRVAIDAVNNKVVEAISAEIAAAQAHLDAKA